MDAVTRTSFSNVLQLLCGVQVTPQELSGCASVRRDHDVYNSVRLGQQLPAAALRGGLCVRRVPGPEDGGGAGAGRLRRTQHQGRGAGEMLLTCNHQGAANPLTVVSLHGCLLNLLYLFTCVLNVVYVCWGADRCPAFHPSESLKRLSNSKCK